MSWEPLWAEASPIPSHAIAALLSLVLGIVQLASPKGTLLHKIVGRAWVVSLGFVAVSSFFIYELRMIGPISPIHVLSVLTLYSLFVGVRAAQQENIRLHRTVMRNLFWFALVITGWFTLIPGRTMHAVIFGG